MGQDKIDTQFLKDTVADVLVRACSECAVSQPKDPVGFVAGWLDQSRGYEVDRAVLRMTPRSR